MKIKLHEVRLKNDCFIAGRGAYVITDKHVLMLELDTERQEVVIECSGAKKFEVPWANILYKRNRDVSKPKKKAKKAEKFEVENLDAYPGE